MISVPLELVTYTAEDGLDLDAAFYPARAGERSQLPLVILTHGAWMSFYTGVPRLLPPFLVEAGFDCLAINNRDHDLGSLDPSTSRCFGMLRCRFDDFVPDLGGALRWAAERAYGQVVLVCHSYSSQRAAYYLSERGAGPISALVMASAPPWIQEVHEHWFDHFDQLAAEAAQLVAEGRPEEILIDRPGASFPMVVSAGTFADLWLGSSRIDDLSYMEGLTTPLLIVVGERDRPWVESTIDKVRSRWGRPAPVAEIPGTGHYYRENPAGLADAVIPWLRETLAETGQEP